MSFSQISSDQAAEVVRLVLADLGLGGLATYYREHQFVHRHDSHDVEFFFKLTFPGIELARDTVGGLTKTLEPLQDAILGSRAVRNEHAAITQDLKDKQQEVDDLQAQVAQLEKYRIHYEMERGISET